MAQKSYITIWTEKARNDLSEIYDFQSIISSNDRAYDLIQNILTKVEILATMPYVGSKEPLLANLKRDYRRLVEGNYKIIYFVRNQKVYIHRIFDTRQNPTKLK